MYKYIIYHWLTKYAWDRRSRGKLDFTVAEVVVRGLGRIDIWGRGLINSSIAILALSKSTPYAVALPRGLTGAINIRCHFGGENCACVERFGGCDHDGPFESMLELTWSEVKWVISWSGCDLRVWVWIYGVCISVRDIWTSCCSVVIIGRLSWTSKYNGRLKAWTPWALGRWTDGTLARKERWV